MVGGFEEVVNWDWERVVDWVLEGSRGGSRCSKRGRMAGATCRPARIMHLQRLRRITWMRMAFRRLQVDMVRHRPGKQCMGRGKSRRTCLRSRLTRLRSLPTTLTLRMLLPNLLTPLLCRRIPLERLRMTTTPAQLRLLRLPLPKVHPT